MVDQCTRRIVGFGVNRGVLDAVGCAGCSIDQLAATPRRHTSARTNHPLYRFHTTSHSPPTGAQVLAKDSHPAFRSWSELTALCPGVILICITEVAMPMTIRLSARTERAVHALARRRRQTRSDIVRDALKHTRLPTAATPAGDARMTPGSTSSAWAVLARAIEGERRASNSARSSARRPVRGVLVDAGPLVALLDQNDVSQGQRGVSQNAPRSARHGLARVHRSHVPAGMRRGPARRLSGVVWKPGRSHWRRSTKAMRRACAS